MKTLMLFAALAALDDALNALTDAFSDNNYILGGVALAVIAALAVLKILKKDFPFTEPLAKLLIAGARMFKSNDQKVKEEAAKQAVQNQPGLDNVVPLEKPEDKK